MAIYIRSFRLFALRYPIRVLQLSLTVAIAFAIAIVGSISIHFTMSRALPYPGAEQLFVLWRHQKGDLLNRVGTSVPELESARPRINAEIGNIGGFVIESINVRIADGQPMRLLSGKADPHFFDVLRVPLQAGTYDSFRRADQDVIYISSGLWARLFNQSRSLDQLTVTAGKHIYRVGGVLPETFYFWNSEIDIWVPYQAADYAGEVRNRFLTTIVRVSSMRVNEGVARERMLAALSRVLPSSDSIPYELELVSLRNAFYSDLTVPLNLIMTAVGLILMLSIVAVTIFVLQDLIASQADYLIMIALGASVAHIRLLAVTKTLGVVTVGAVGGLLLVPLLTSSLRALIPTSAMPVLPAKLIGDGSILGVIGSLYVGATIVATLTVVSALYLMLDRDNVVIPSVKGSMNRSKRTGFRFLIAAQMACITPLVCFGTAATQLAITFSGSPNGMDLLNVSTGRLIAYSQMGSRERLVSFFEELLLELRHLPGVRAAGLVSQLPLSPTVLATISDVSAPDRSRRVLMRIASEGYIDVLKVQLRKGRFFSTSDSASSDSVIVINQTLAKSMFGEQEAVGKRLAIKGYGKSNDVWVVIGVINDISLPVPNTPSTAPTPEALISFRQSPQAPMSLLVRTEQDQDMSVALRRLLSEKLSDTPLFASGRLQSVLTQQWWRLRLACYILMFLCGLATIISISTIYSVVTLSVTENERRIGIELAMGAPSHRVVYSASFGEIVALIAGCVAGAAVWILGRGAFLGTVTSQLEPGYWDLLAGVVIALTLFILIVIITVARSVLSRQPIELLR